MDLLGVMCAMNHAENVTELRNYKQRLATALKSAKICVFEVDLVQQLYTFFENSEDIFGVPGEKILREVQPFSMLSPDEYRLAVSDYFSHPADLKVIEGAFAETLCGRSTTYEARMKAGNTNFIWCKIDISPIMEDGVPVRMIGVITDISAIKAKTDLLTKKASLDSFTGLYAKKYVEDRIKSILAQENNKTHYIILFDLDNFKQINDTYGHIEGDRVLRGVSERLKYVFRSTDAIGRFGGDEFIILVKDLKEKADLIKYLNVLMDSSDNDYGVTKSIGVSVYPDDGRDYEQLLTKADEALYYSKCEKNRYTFFSEL